MENQKLKESLTDLELAIESYAGIKTGKLKEKRMAFLSLSKAYEVALEYFWRYLKRCVRDEGLDPQSPKSAIRDAARLG